MITLMKNNRLVKRFRKSETLKDYIDKNIVNSNKIKFRKELSYFAFDYANDTYWILF